MLPGTGSKGHLLSGSQDLGSKASGLPPIRILIGECCPAFFFFFFFKSLTHYFKAPIMIIILQQRMRWLDGITDSIDMSEQTLGDGEGQGSPVRYSPWGGRELGTTERLKNNNECNSSSR